MRGKRCNQCDDMDGNRSGNASIRDSEEGAATLRVVVILMTKMDSEMKMVRLISNIKWFIMNSYFIII